MMIRLLFLLMAFAVPCQADDAKNGFWWGKGWGEDQTKEDNKYPAPPPLPSVEEMVQMHPEELRRLENERLDYALYKQTEETVADYYRVVSAIRQKSKRFASISSFNAQTHPDLNLKKDIPITNSGRKSKQEQRSQEMASRLSREKQNYALILFTQDSCPACKPARAVAQRFSDKHQWTVKEIDIARDPTIGERYGIRYTPTTMLIKRGTKDYLPIAYGVDSVSSLESLTFRSIQYLAGELSADQFGTYSDSDL